MKRTIITYTLALGALAALLFLVYKGVSVARSLFAPAVHASYASGTWFNRITHPWGNQKQLRDENDRLIKLVQQLLVNQSACIELQNDFANLKALIGYQDRENTTPIMARVIGYAKDPFREAVYIDRGVKDGVVLNAPILIQDGIFIGTVIRVWDGTSLMLLARDARSKIPAKVMNRDGAIGILEGHGAQYRLTLIPRDIEVVQDDIVVTEASGTTIPSGLVIGRVTAVLTSEESPFKTAFVEPLAIFDEESFVSVLPASVVLTP